MLSYQKSKFNFLEDINSNIGEIDCSNFDKNELEAFLYLMTLIRAAEVKIADGKKEKYIKGPVHLGVGQEAIATGISKALLESDKVFGAHRSHSHILSLDSDIHKLFAEVLGKKTGFSNGMGGSMHLISEEKGFMGSVPIVSGTIPLALGAGLACKLRETDNIAVSYLGDGATEEGVFHESLNFAKINKIPILFVVENNLFSSHMHISLRQPNHSTARFAEANAIKYEIVDGNNVLEINNVASKFIRSIREKGEPHFIEAITYRWYGHVDWREDIDVGVARSKRDLEIWKKRDPILRLKEQMVKEKLWTNKEQKILDAKIQNIIEESWLKALMDEFPDPNSLKDNVYKKN